MQSISKIFIVIGVLTSMHSTAQQQPGNEEVRSLKTRVSQLESEVQELQALVAQLQSSLSMPSSKQASAEKSSQVVAPRPADSRTLEDQSALDFLRDTTVNLGMDGYYSYNFNHPVGRVNLLRAYDVTSNSFSLNQANVILERAPNLAAGRRFGARLDLQFGQATETLQGSAVNEPRPQVYRPIFQAYGTYVVALGSGLTVDFGKWASALGYENNYSKDQFNYSRSYFFNFLPFYHMGFRATYDVNERLSLGYWLVNGVQQTEDFNGFKSQALQVIVKPAKRLQWNFVYYTGKEQRDLIPLVNPGSPTLPTQPGLSTDVIRPTPDGRLHILDTYISWNLTPRLTLAGEGDYVIDRLFEHSAPAQVSGGAGYLYYQLTPKISASVRSEYLSDHGGLFSGTTQALKENTLSFDHKLADGFLMRYEWRRDFSNHRMFLGDVAGLRMKQQTTASVGLIWWWGRKQGSW